MKLHDEIKKRCEGYPLYSQENVSDPIVCAKLFYPGGAATWYIIEYNPVTCVAFGYVAGIGCDEWGYFSVSEMLEIEIKGALPIELDLYFRPRKASGLGLMR